MGEGRARPLSEEHPWTVMLLAALSDLVVAADSEVRGTNTWRVPCCGRGAIFTRAWPVGLHRPSDWASSSRTQLMPTPRNTARAVRRALADADELGRRSAARTRSLGTQTARHRSSRTIVVQALFSAFFISGVSISWSRLFPRVFQLHGANIFNFSSRPRVVRRKSSMVDYHILFSAWRFYAVKTFSSHKPIKK